MGGWIAREFLFLIFFVCEYQRLHGRTQWLRRRLAVVGHAVEAVGHLSWRVWSARAWLGWRAGLAGKMGRNWTCGRHMDPALSPACPSRPPSLLFDARPTVLGPERSTDPVK